MTLKQYLAARHIVVRPDGREHHSTASWRTRAGSAT
jgi:hypothetical protein